MRPIRIFFCSTATGVNWRFDKLVSDMWAWLLPFGFASDWLTVMDWATDKIPGGVPSMSATEKNIYKL